MARVGKTVRRSGQLDPRPMFLVIGVLLVVLAVFMIPPMIADLVVNNPDWWVFLGSAWTTLFVGIALILAFRGTSFSELSTRQAFLLTASVWLVLTIFASLPFAYADLRMPVADAFFEAMSGITTTGATVIADLTLVPPGLLLWRSILQWLGGIGIIVMGVAVLPLLSVGGMQLFRTESSDSSDKILPRAAQLASAIGVIYVVLTVACAMTYIIGGMDVFDAANHAMTTVATGGYSTRNGSIGEFDSPLIEWSATIFMLIGGVPFVLYIQALNGQPKVLVRDAQVRWFFGIVLLSWFILAGDLFLSDAVEEWTALRMAAFNTTAVITGTGYASSNYNLWGHLPVAYIFFLMCVGGCTGSTTGGIKVFRFAVLYAIARTQILRLIQPSGVFPATYNGRALPDAAAISVMAFFFLFALCFSVLTLALSFVGLDYLTAMSASISALANVGPGLGPLIGPAGTFAPMPVEAKWLLSAGMLLGRLELFTILVLLAPAFWRT